MYGLAKLVTEADKVLMLDWQRKKWQRKK
jgi:hypothetical protein